MKTRFRSGALFLGVATSILLLLGISMTLAPPAQAQSLNVAIVDGPVVSNGGTFPTGGSFAVFNFTNLPVANVTAANLAGFDTVLLNVASGGMGCNVNSLSAQAKTDLVDFVNSGGKLIIYDSECSPQDYSWLPFPFTTSNPGAQGANGTLTIFEDNALSTLIGDPDCTGAGAADPLCINVALLGSGTDAVGDMNVMTTLDPNWCLDMEGTNVQQVSGPVHVYAHFGAGLIIYNGMDVDFMGSNSEPDTTTGSGSLAKVWFQELQAAKADLPCGVSVVGRNHYLGYTAREPRGSISPSATATLTDQFGTGKYKVVGKSVTHFNPVEKTHGEDVSPIINEFVHLEAYGLMRLEGTHTPQTVEVTNQFGTITVTTKSPSKLMVPSTKAIGQLPPRELPNIEALPEEKEEHFLCYSLDSYSGFSALTVGVNDQFDEFRVNGTNNFLVFRPIYLCNPVAKQLEGKEEEPIKNEAAHLLCYGGGFKDRRSLSVNIGVNNQIVEASGLEGQTLDITREAGTLCVPSTKEIPNGGFCGDGVLDPGEECDDGNNVDGDGCSANCTDETPK